MRTERTLDADVLRMLEERARREDRSLDEIASRPLRESLARAHAASESYFGIEPLPARTGTVSNELVDRLRDREGI